MIETHVEGHRKKIMEYTSMTQIENNGIYKHELSRIVQAYKGARIANSGMYKYEIIRNWVNH